MTVLLLGLLVEVVVAALTSPYLNITQIIVAGNITISDADITKVVDLPPDTNIFRLKVHGIIDDLLLNPVIKTVRLHRKLPSTLIISIVEREADSLLSASGVMYEVDNEGVAFRAPKKVNDSLPEISYDMPRRVLLGRQITDPAFVASRRCIELSRTVSPLQISKIVVAQNGDLCLNIHDRFIVKLGRPIGLEHKMEIASQVLIQIPRFRATGEYIDVTAPEAPAVRYKK